MMSTRSETEPKAVRASDELHHRTKQDRGHGQRQSKARVKGIRGLGAARQQALEQNGVSSSVPGATTSYLGINSEYLASSTRSSVLFYPSPNIQCWVYLRLSMMSQSYNCSSSGRLVNVHSRRSLGTAAS